MEPQNEEAGNPPPDRESAEVNTDILSSEIAAGIKRNILGEATVTYDNNFMEGKQRDCFLLSPDKKKSMVISYIHTVWDEDDNPDIRGSIKIRIIDRTGEPPSGYELSLRPPINDDAMTDDERFIESGINYYPSLPAVSEFERKPEETDEAVYGVSFEDIDIGSLSAEQLREKRKQGLLQINELLKHCIYDRDAIVPAKEWLRTSENRPPINDLQQLTDLRPTFEAVVDKSLVSLPHVVNRQFSK